MEFTKISTFLIVCCVCRALGGVIPLEVGDYKGPYLESYKDVPKLSVIRGAKGTYKFEFSLPDHRRQEQRTEDGKVEGSFEFLDPVGEKVALKYSADEDGFVAESNAIPTAPEDTDDVKKAKEEFHHFYKNMAKYLKSLSENDKYNDDYDEDDDSSSSEEDEEEGYGNANGEENEEESEEDDDDADGDSSEEEHEEEESEEDEEDEDEGEEEEEEGEEKEEVKGSNAEEHEAEEIKEEEVKKQTGLNTKEEEKTKDTTKGKPKSFSLFGRRTSRITKNTKELKN